MLNFHITVDDNGELKTITRADLKEYDALGEFMVNFDNLLNTILDKRVTSVVVAMGAEPETWDDLVEEANRQLSDEPDPVLDPPPDIYQQVAGQVLNQPTIEGERTVGMDPALGAGFKQAVKAEDGTDGLDV
jgi:hypothetical protein